MLMPKRVKYRKQQRGRRKGKALRGSEVSFGEFGVKALEPAWLTNKQIAARLGISDRTVQFHLGNVLGKLGVASRTEAAVLALQRGLV